MSELFQNLIWDNILSVKNNRLQILDKIDITSYGSRAWADTLQEIGKMKGNVYLEELGYAMGSEAATELNEVLQQQKDYIPSDLNTLPNLIRLAGFGMVRASEKENEIELTVEEDHIIDFGITMFGNNSLMCNFYLGVYKAFIETLRKTGYNVSHEKCKSHGQPSCVFIMRKNV